MNGPRGGGAFESFGQNHQNKIKYNMHVFLWALVRALAEALGLGKLLAIVNRFFVGVKRVVSDVQACFAQPNGTRDRMMTLIFSCMVYTKKTRRNTSQG